MRRIIKFLGCSEGVIYIYFIIMILLECYALKNYTSLWYTYLIIPIIAIPLSIALIYIHIIIDYILHMGLPDKEKEYEWKIKDLQKEIYDLKIENQKLKNK